MSTTPVAPAPSRVDMIGSILEPPPATPVAPTPVETPPAPPPVPDPAAPPDPAPADPVAPPEEEPPADDSDLETASAQPNEPVTVTHSRWHNSVYPGYKAHKAVTEALGFTPATEDVKSWYQTFIDTDAMAADLAQATPEHAAHFLDYWGERSPQGMVSLLGTIPDYVAQISTRYNNPALIGQMADSLMQHVTQIAVQTGNAGIYGKVATPILQRYESSLYQRAADAIRSPNPQTQEWGRSMLNAAQVLEFERTGAFRQDPAATPPPKEDPLAEDRRRLETERQRLADQQQQHRKQTQTAFESAINTDIHSGVTEVIDAALAPIRANPDYDWYRSHFQKELVERVATLGDRYRQYSIAYERAVSAPSEEAKAALRQLYASMAKTVAQALRPDYLKRATATAVQQNAQTHDQLARASSAVSPSAAPSPPPGPPAPAGANSGERRLALLNSILG